MADLKKERAKLLENPTLDNIQTFINKYGRDELPLFLDVRNPSKTKISSTLSYEDLTPSQKTQLEKEFGTIEETDTGKVFKPYRFGKPTGFSINPFSVSQELGRVSGGATEEIARSTLDLLESGYEAVTGNKASESAKKVKNFVINTAAQLGGARDFEIAQDEDGMLYYKIVDPKTGAGQLTETVAPFISVVGATKKLGGDAAEELIKKSLTKKRTRGRPSTKALDAAAKVRGRVGLGSALVQTEVAAQLLLDPEDGRIAYDLGQYFRNNYEGAGSEYINAFVDYLDLTDPAELSEAENRVGMAVENLLLGGTIGVAFKTLQGAYGLSKEGVIKLLNKIRGQGPQAKEQFKRTLTQSAKKPSVAPTAGPEDVSVQESLKGVKFFGKQFKYSNSPILRSMQNFYKGLFSSQGNLTPQLFNIIRANEKSTIMWSAKAENLANNLEKTVENLVKNKTFKNDNEVNDFITNVLTQKRGIKNTNYYKNLPNNIKNQLDEIRITIDDLGAMLGGSKYADAKLKAEISANMGKYLRTTYARYEDAGFVPTQQVFDDAVNYLYRNTTRKLNDKGVLETDAELKKRVTEYAKGFLNQSDEAGLNSYLQTLGDDVLKKSNKSLKVIYGDKKNFAPEIAALLGRETNISTRVFRTVERLSSDLFRYKLYDDVFSKGQGVYFFNSEEAAKKVFGNNVKKIQLSKTFEQSGLNNQYTTPELAKFFTRVKAQEEVAGNFSTRAFTFFLMSKGLGQAAATVGNFYTHLRNTYGQATIMLSNGLKPFSRETDDAFAILKDRLKKGGERELQKTYEEFLELGIVNQSVNVGDFKRLVNSYSRNKANTIDKSPLFNQNLLQTTVDKSGRLIKDKATKAYNVATDLYVAEDDLFRIATFEQELKILKEANKLLPQSQRYTLTELRREAADITRNTLPTYELVPATARQLRKLPIGNFFSFHAERFRNTVETYKRAIQEIFSGNEVLMNRGLDRLAGKIVYGALGYEGLSRGTKLLFNISDEDEKNYKDLAAPPWAKNSNFVYFKTPEGKLYYLDTQFTDPDAPVNNFVRGILNEITDPNTPKDGLMKKIDDVTLEALRSLFAPFVDEALLTERVVDSIVAAFGSEEGRRKIKPQLFDFSEPGLQEGEFGKNAAKTVTYVAESVVPVTLRQLVAPEKLGNAIYRELTEENPVNRYEKPIDSKLEFIVNATGLRFNSLDDKALESALRFKLRRLNKATNINESRIDKYVANAINNPNVSYDDILENYRVANEEYYRQYVNGIRAIEAAKNLNLNRAVIEEIIEEELTNFVSSRKDRVLIGNTKFTPLEYSKTSEDTLFFSAKLGVRDNQTAARFRGNLTQLASQFSDLPTINLDVTEEDIERFKKLENDNIVARGMEDLGASLEDIIFKRYQRSTGGLVEGPEVPNTKEDAADAINPYTGLTYSGKTPIEQQMEDLLEERIGFAEGNKVENPAAKYTDDPFIQQIIMIESSGNPNAESKAGAKGLMQIMAATAKNPGFGVKPFQGDNLFDPKENVRFGTDYVNSLIKTTGNKRDGIIAYNFGYGNLQKWKKEGGDLEKLPEETQNYLKRLGLYNK